MTMPLVQREQDPDFWEERSADYLPVSAVDKLGAEFDLASTATAVPQIADLIVGNKLESVTNQRTLPVKELQEKYPGISWSEPKKELVADYIFRESEKRRKLESVAQRGPDGKLMSVMGFGANLAAHLLDPAEMAANVLTGGALRGAGLFTSAGFKTTVARGAAEGIITEPLSEGLNIASEAQHYRSVTLGQSAANLGLGVVAGGAFEGIGYGLGRLKDRMRLSAAAQMLNNKHPNVAPIKNIWDNERLGVGANPGKDWSGRTNYAFTPVDANSPLTTKIFIGTNGQGDDFRLVNPGMNQNSRLGFGVARVGVDSAVVANGHAASSFNDAPGVIHEVQIDSARVLSLDEPIPQNAGSAVSQVISEIADRVDSEILQDLSVRLKNGESITGKQIYTALEDAPEGAADAVNSVLRSEGYDALHYTDAANDGTGKHNGFVVLNEEKLRQTGAFQSDKSLIGGLSDNEVDDIIAARNDPAQELGYDQKTVDSVKAAEETLEQDIEITPQEQLALVNQELKLMEESGTLKEHHLADLRALDESLAKQKKLGEGVMRSLSICLSRS